MEEGARRRAALALKLLSTQYQASMKEGSLEVSDVAASVAFQGLPFSPAGRRPSKAAMAVKGGILNRYFNVLPYEYNRVKLARGAGAEDDYINASHVESGPGDAARYSYIATQGPLDHTIGDFWKMVLQQRAPAVFMLNNFVEDDMPKCAPYLPVAERETLESGPVTVQCATMSEMPHGITQRKLEVRDASTGEATSVDHFHFPHWPDHGTPDHGQGLLELSRLARGYDSGRPLVVHCSAGIGRTGTFCMIDVALRRALTPREGVADNDAAAGASPHTLLEELREKRIGMVQTIDQFKFACNLIMHELRRVAGA